MPLGYPAKRMVRKPAAIPCIKPMDTILSTLYHMMHILMHHFDIYC